MVTRKSEAEWQGDLKSGKGSVAFGSGAFTGSYSFPSRFEDGSGTNPEEMIAAAHASCYSMALSHGLASAGYTPESVRTVAHLQLDKVEGGFAISSVRLVTEARVPGIEEAAFQDQAQDAKANCPVSKALAAIQIDLDAKLL